MEAAGKIVARNPRKSNFGKQLNLWWLLAVILGGWVVLTWGKDVWYNPVKIVGAYSKLLADYQMFKNIYLSTGRVVTGFLFALVFAIPIGIAVGMSKRISAWFEPVIDMFRYMAPIAWIPLSIFWFKGGDASSVFIVAYAAFFPVVVQIIAGIRNVPVSYLEAGSILGAKRSDLIFHVYIPVTLHEMLVGSRIAMSTAWAAIVAAELSLASQSGQIGSNGLGQLMFVLYYNEPDISLIAATMLIVGVLALIFDQIIQVLKKIFLKW